MKRQIEAGARKDKNGQFAHNKHNIIEDWHYGHKRGFENRRILRAADEMGMTQAELNDFANAHPDYYQIEDAKTNLSHANEKPGYNDLREIKRDMKLLLKDRSQ
ncbi:GH-E family nuclease [Vibrio campbellii]|uniref:HNH/endo VII family nuclease n=1 Tax=Vibrio campbellii TaxID=680 RepID=A0ABY5ILV8_9VIBR|nr:HNH/endo VII family nuclease [Vibrio campbellii]UTZ35227.1 HNH/endo VII family nuclease [Vibrio campbellii]